jgi:hypothetical protein
MSGNEVVLVHVNQTPRASGRRAATAGGWVRWPGLTDNIAHHMDG